MECGYCANGSFSFELTAGVATNAVSISNDRSHERAIKILGAATSIHEELRSALRGRIQAVGSRKKPSAKKEEPDSSFNSPMKRAFLGLPPIHGTGEDSRASKLDRVDKQGSVVKFVARPESSHSSSRSSVAAVDRTRSLLRLARQVRSETGSSSDRRRSSDVIIRQLGRGLAIDHLDDENGLFGLLEGNDVLDSSEPLSRVIASVQSRRRDDAVRSSARENGGDGGSGPSPKKTESGKEVIEDCQKLHMLMREAERERYELNRRIEAWKRLDNGSLAENSAGSAGPMIYSPSHCSVCGPTVALQLLILWLRLFLARPSDVKIDQDFLCLLLEDIPSVSKGLSDCKRQVVREIATKSKDGAQLVLSELRKRLSATNDITSAEILGKIMGVEGFLMAEEYSKLAIEVLAARQASFS